MVAAWRGVKVLGRRARIAQLSAATVAVCALVLLLWPAVSVAGLIRERGPDGQFCPVEVHEDTPADCQPTATGGTRAVVFDAYAATAKSELEKANRLEVDFVKGDLDAEGYDVSEKEGPSGYQRPLLSRFLAIAKVPPSVLFISTHGFNPNEAGRDCTADKALYRDYLKEHHDSLQSPPASLPPLASLVCKRDEPALLVEVDQSGPQMWEDLQAAIKSGINPEWIDGDHFGGSDGRFYGITVPSSGLKHFFSGKPMDMVFADACHSMSFSGDFDATAYFGYRSTACVGEDVHDVGILFDRLVGKDGISLRDTTSAFRAGGFRSPVFELAEQRPVVLSPAVEDVYPYDGQAVEDGQPFRGLVEFDAETGHEDPGGVISVKGCGASLSDVSWSETDPTALDFTLNVPQGAEGRMTFTVDPKLAATLNGAELDGNGKPADTSGLAPNRDAYTWTASCTPAPTVPQTCPNAEGGELPPGPYQPCRFTASYQASYDYQDVEQDPPYTQTTTVHASWSETWNGSYWAYDNLTGTVSYADTQNPSNDCSASLSLNPADAPYYGQLPNDAGYGSGGPTDEPSIRGQDDDNIEGQPTGTGEVDFLVEYPAGDILEPESCVLWDGVSPLAFQNAGFGGWSGASCQYANTGVDEFTFAIPGNHSGVSDDCTLTGGGDASFDGNGTLQQTISLSAPPDSG